MKYNEENQKHTYNIKKKNQKFWFVLMKINAKITENLTTEKKNIKKIPQSRKYTKTNGNSKQFFCEFLRNE